MRNIAFRVCLFVAICIAAPNAGRASSVYVAAVPGELAAEAKVAVAAPAPVQLIFRFTINGISNVAITDSIKPIIADLVRATGVFSAISELPVESGGSITIVVSNVFDTAEQKATLDKAFITGLTFGLSGTLATDNIVSNFEYRPAGAAEPITASIEHAIITRFGRAKAPEGAVKAKNNEEATMTVLRQSVDNGLNRIAADPRFAAATAGMKPASPSASGEQAAQR